MPLPDITLPQWCAQIGRRLPALPPRFALVQTLNLMLKRGLLPADMSLFDGRTFEIDVLDGRTSLDEALPELTRLATGTPVDGYWLGKPGIEAVEAHRKAYGINAA